MDTLTITIIFVALSTAIAAILKAFKKDKCLKDFRKFNVRLLEIDKEEFRGKMRLESSGLEIIYSDKQKNGVIKSSYILYKNEYTNIKLLIRALSDLTEENLKRREKSLEKSYHPSRIRKSYRSIINFCTTIKDAITEVINLLLNHFKKSSNNQASSVLSQQSRHVSKIQNDLVGSVGRSSFDPLLENHIGDIMVVTLSLEGKPEYYVGVLKEYTQDFFEIMNVSLEIDEYGTIEVVDLVIPRKYSIIKNYGE